MKSLDGLQELAKAVFEENPTEKEVYATADGNIFLSDSFNAAKLHANTTNQELYTIENGIAINTDETIADEEEASGLADPDAEVESSALTVESSALPAKEKVKGSKLKV